MSLKIATAPALEPITLDEAKLHLRIDTSPTTTHADDDLVTALIVTARRFCEGFQNRAYITQTWDLYLDDFPGRDYIEVPLPPLQSVTYLKYKDTAGTLQTWASSNYIVDINSEPGRISLAYGKSWPSTYGEIQAVQIRFVCGYGDAATDVPSEVKTAMYLQITDMYENRGDNDMRQENAYNEAVKLLLSPEKMYRV